MFRSVRNYSAKTTGLIKSVKPAVPTVRESKSFNANFPEQRRQKAWDKAGEDKDTFFRTKYAHVHAAQKKFAEENPDKVKKYIPQREWNDKHRNDSKSTWKPPLRQQRTRLKPSPLSEYIYGTTSVLAALKANKREYFSKLIVNNPKEKAKDILALAEERKIKVVFADSKGDLNDLTNNAVHNGYVLETKPLRPVEIKSLGVCDPEGTYEIQQEAIYGEESFLTGEVVREIPETREDGSVGKRFPVGLYLDEISDPHNIGALIRSAYFLGVDFIVVSDRNCAPLSPVVAKVSVGALEYMPIYTSEKPLNFFDVSRQNGWVIVSATTTSNALNTSNKSAIESLKDRQIDSESLKVLGQESPVLLVLGSEGDGIRTSLKLRSDFIVELRNGREIEDGVIDSLNVSVAGALLMEKLLH